MTAFLLTGKRSEVLGAEGLPVPINKAMRDVSRPRTATTTIKLVKHEFVLCVCPACAHSQSPTPLAGSQQELWSPRHGGARAIAPVP